MIVANPIKAPKISSRLRNRAETAASMFARRISGMTIGEWREISNLGSVGLVYAKAEIKYSKTGGFGSVKVSVDETGVELRGPGALQVYFDNDEVALVKRALESIYLLYTDTMVRRRHGDRPLVYVSDDFLDTRLNFGHIEEFSKLESLSDQVFFGLVSEYVKQEKKMRLDESTHQRLERILRQKELAS